MTTNFVPKTNQADLFKKRLIAIDGSDGPQILEDSNTPVIVLQDTTTSSASGNLDDAGPPAPGYTFTTLDDPVSGINDEGQIVGTYNNVAVGTRSFLYSDGTYSTLDDDPLAAGGYTLAAGINNAGQIVGSYLGSYEGSAGTFGFLYSGGDYNTLSDPLSVPEGSLPQTVAYGINNAGQIVGYYVDNTGDHGFLYSGGTYLTLNDPLASPGQTTAYGINDAGQIVGLFGNASGAHGFLYSGGTYTTLDDPLAGRATVALGINNAGQIVGEYDDSSGGEHGFLYSGGTYTTIDDPLAFDGPSEGTTANGINNVGQIVGSYNRGLGLGGFITQRCRGRRRSRHQRPRQWGRARRRQSPGSASRNPPRPPVKRSQ
jgi:probable HAF family extracellular repeat protein